MNTRRLVSTEAERVGRVLHEYIHVHDDMFGGGLWRTLRKTVPIPGFFHRIDFQGHAVTLTRLHEQLIQNAAHSTH